VTEPSEALKQFRFWTSQLKFEDLNEAERFFEDAVFLMKFNLAREAEKKLEGVNINEVRCVVCEAERTKEIDLSKTFKYGFCDKHFGLKGKDFPYTKDGKDHLICGNCWKCKTCFSCNCEESKAQFKKQAEEAKQPKTEGLAVIFG